MIGFTSLALLAVLAISVRAAEAPKILSRDHTVEVRSTVPAIAGQSVKLYVSERVSAAMPERIAGDKVVLFVHGAGTPGSVAFDVPYQDYSWMAFLAAAGFDAAAVDLTGCCTRISAAARKSSPISPALRTARCGSEITGSFSVPRSNGWTAAPSTASRTARCGWATRPTRRANRAETALKKPPVGRGIRFAIVSRHGFP